MSGILDVVHPRELGSVVNQLGHDAKPGPGFEKADKGVPFPGGMVEMLHRFGASHKIIGSVQNFWRGFVKGVIKGDPVPTGFEHLRQYGARAAAKIQPVLRGRPDVGDERLDELIEEATVSSVGGVVLMQIIARFFFFGGEQLTFGDENQTTALAAQIIPLRAVIEKFWLGFFAQRTGSIHNIFDVSIFCLEAYSTG